jgi:hypothetical protein
VHIYIYREGGRGGGRERESEKFYEDNSRNFVKVKQSHYRLGVAQGLPGS